MANSSIWGHGAYLGPDYSAEALHRMGEHTAEAIAQQQYQQPLVALSRSQQAAVRGETTVALKTNRYDAATATLHLTAPQTAAYRQQIDYWTDYFRHPARNGGLKPDLIKDATELRQFAAFITWTAWASVAARPSEDYSYTNNFPYDPSVGNVPTPDALFWIATSYGAAALFLGRSLRADEPRWLAGCTHALFAAFALVIGGSLLGEWLGLSQLLGHWRFWFGNQGWGYLELGRLWQYLLVASLSAWFVLLWILAQPAAKPIVRMFLAAALAIPVFYVPALFFGAKTNFTVVDTWRFWIIHL